MHALSAEETIAQTKTRAAQGRRAAPAGRRSAACLPISNFALQTRLNSGSLAVCENQWPSGY